MGHYYSEMVSDDERQRQADQEQRSRRATAARIREAIDREGIEFVLADIIADPTMAKVRYRRFDWPTPEKS